MDSKTKIGKAQAVKEAMIERMKAFVQKNPLASPAQVLHVGRGRAPKGMRWRDRNVYHPAGRRMNVAGTKSKNPAQAYQTNVMYVQWYQKKFGKPCPDMAQLFGVENLQRNYAATVSA